MSNNKSETHNGRDQKSGQFKLGHIGLGGRPRGSRNKLGEQFISDLYDEWQKSGPDVLKKVAEEDPVALMRCVASILPKEIDAKLSVDIDLLKEETTFMEYYRVCREFIGASPDNVPLIEDKDEKD